MTTSRPQRWRLPDFAGRPVTLPEDGDAWRQDGQGADALVLGLGPGQPWQLPLFADFPSVRWLESPRVAAALAALRAPTPTPPPHWRRISEDEAVAMAPRCRRFLYAAAPRLDPDFWCPLLGRLDAAAMPGQGPLSRRRGAVLLPGDDSMLLHRELRGALAQCGFTAVTVPSGPAGLAPDLAAWRRLLAQSRPAFLLSVNLRGLDAEGRIFHLCRALRVPVAIWFVDNPWHLLSSIRLPWWKEALLLATDAACADSLAAEGAGEVHCLPLAVAPHMWRDVDAHGRPAGGGLFVGRSAFPGKDRFFAAARLPQAAMDAAARLLAASRGPVDAPHFFWWLKRLGGALWPGHDARRVGRGAEECAQANRRRWLLAAGAGRPGILRVVGDDGWKNLLPGADIRSPVDYYTALPALYATAEAVLNVTSLLLPHSLSQRHFDVWASGGALFSDATPGLDIFPAELTEPMTLGGPMDFPPRLDWLRAHPREAAALRRGWRDCLRRDHGYAQRVGLVADLLGVRAMRQAPPHRRFA